MNDGDYRTLETERDGKLLVVSLNRPDRLNAVGDGMLDELVQLWRDIRQDNTVGAVLLRGNGRSFCVGGDVSDMESVASGKPTPADIAPRMVNILRESKALLTEMLEVEQPIVCAVQGHAIGLGATIALFADIVLATPSTKFADPHVKVGLVAGDGGGVIWPLLMSINTAKYYLLTGDSISGDRALALGLVQELVPAEQLDERARDLAGDLANGASLALRFTKTSVNKILRERVNLLLDTSLILEAGTMFSVDHAEAARAFTAKRTPTFTGQ
jgi:enoyl-CoA hydratase